MPACSPITGTCASLTLESVKLEVKLLAPTTLRVVTPTILGGRDPTSCSAHTWQEPQGAQGSQLGIEEYLLLVQVLSVTLNDRNDVPPDIGSL